MSNTSIVSPYAKRISRTFINTSKTVTQLASVAEKVAQWLWEPSVVRPTIGRQVEAAQCQVVLNMHATLCEASQASEQLSTINAAVLYAQNVEPLVRSAEMLGYHLEPRESSTIGHLCDSALLLSKASGERLAITQDDNRLVIHTAGDEGKLTELVRQHTFDRAVEHFAGQGMQVQTAVLPNGEIQIQAQESNAGLRGGPAKITTNVCADGTAVVDVDGIRGNRCVEIATGIASALGGQLSTVNKKSSYYQLPVETARVEIDG